LRRACVILPEPLPEPATPETVFKVASVGKQFITARIKLAQEGRLQLDDAMAHHLEDAPIRLERDHDPAPAHAYLGARSPRILSGVYAAAPSGQHPNDHLWWWSLI
jgi:hypothetical protein